MDPSVVALINCSGAAPAWRRPVEAAHRALPGVRDGLRIVGQGRHAMLGLSFYRSSGSLGESLTVRVAGRRAAPVLSTSVPMTTVPKERTAVVIDKDTPLGETAIKKIPTPKIGDDELLVEVHAASVNALDWLISKTVAGVPNFIRQSAYVPGKDLSGVVLQVGKNVRDIAVGDEVFGMTGFVLKPTLDMFNPEKLAGGAYATIATLKAPEAAVKPSTCTHAEAAAVPLAGLTVWAALVDAAKLKPGCKVLVLGGAGGVGTLAIQIAKAHCKAAVVATTCSAASADLVKRLGADIVIDYKTSNFEDVLQGEKYDCVLDCVGYDSKFSRAKAVLDPASGQLIDLVGPPVIGYLRRGENADDPISFGKQALELGSEVRYQLVGVGPNGPALRSIAKLMEEGSVKPVVDKVFDGLEMVQQAFDYNESGSAHGKAIIQVVQE